ncbi:flavohemoprotein [Streptomyces kaniharaensis]|uniref:nitric oxide dioxygenase n=1 Tax=Streptomyces kaniharaensis TaxID=212423 RepID=A0A6N7L1T9_9ACTN|nr:globin domain-containing protein [Streptomyces kaniharaensis]MQS15753.1 flavohemoprotein [Streptomyces kaniharaensis]
MKSRATHPVSNPSAPENPQDRPQPTTNGTGALLSERDIALLRASVAAVEPYAADLPAHFYATLFHRYPQVRDLFPQRMEIQHDKLVRALLLIVDLVDDPDTLVRFCSELGRDHRKFGTQSEHYAAVGECLLATLEHFAGPAWTADVAAAWTRAYTAAAQAMDGAATADAAERPAVWDARIVHHHRYGPDLAEITVRTDQPYPFTGGQFVSMETPWWPKSWRYYSPANAPRPDGTISFHVRAVPGGPVSNTLVHRAAVGDVLRLGRPLGDMALDPASTRDVVCVAGGTGIAPIRALVEQAVLDGTQRRMDVFVGARSANELHGLEDIQRLSQHHHWLTVRAAVCDADTPGAAPGLPEALTAAGPWREHEAYVSGPGPMIYSAARALYRAGMPIDRIHHDPFVRLDFAL